MSDRCRCSTPACASAAASDTAAPASATRLDRYRVAAMDCPGEERLIRLALEPLGGIAALRFDLAARTLEVWHDRDDRRIDEILASLGLGAECLERRTLEAAEAPPEEDIAGERRVLYILLALNAAMFLVESLGGWWAQSSGLLADGLDMLADALVYGLALWAVGSQAQRQRRAAHLSGWLQAGLAGLILLDVLRRFLHGSEPLSAAMFGIGLLALAVNVTCLWLLLRQRGRGAHLRASLIFSANDVLANLGLLLAAALVALSGSRYPDLFIGLAIVALVLHGAWRILRLR